MSGTSGDGVDAVIACWNPVQLIGQGFFPYPPRLRRILLEVAAGHGDSLARIARLDVRLGRFYGLCCRQLLAQYPQYSSQIRAIGCHGQTVRHQPEGRLPYSWQLGDPHHIATLSGLTTVSDFRRRDIAAGGQGAPLLPLLHQELFADAQERRLVLNLGGIANLTILDQQLPLQGFDCGPANALLDAWHEKWRHGPMDRDGAWAASGKICQPLLQRLLGDPYFQRPAPKSSGREYFHLSWLEESLQALATRPAAADVQATLCRMVASTIASAAAPWQAKRIICCGGGVHNRHLMAEISQQIGPQTRLQSSADCGWPTNAIEALGMAWLARHCLDQRALDGRSVTGAKQALIYGSICPVARAIPSEI